MRLEKHIALFLSIIRVSWFILTERCNFIAISAIVICCLSVCLSSVTRVYCDKITEVRIMRFSHKSSVKTYLLVWYVWRRNSNGVPLIGGLKQELGGFRFYDALSRKRCKVELRWQLITNRKWYMGFRLQQKSMTLNDLERQFTVLSSVLCVLWPNGWG